MVGNRIRKNTKVVLITAGTFPYNTPSANLTRLFSLGLLNNNCDIEVIVQYGKTYNRNSIVDLNGKKGIVDQLKYRYCGDIDKPISQYRKIIDSFLGVVIPGLIILKKALSSRLDIVILHNNYFHEAILVFIICKVFKIKIVHFQVDLFDANWYKTNIPNVIIRNIKIANSNLRNNWLISFFDGAITISHFLQKQLLSKLKNNRKVFLFPHLVFLDTKHNINNSSLRNEGVIGAVGPLNKDNGIDILLQSISEIVKVNNNIKLLLIGGPCSAVVFYKNLAKSLKIEKYVEFSGYVESNEIPHFLNQCDILVLARPNSIYNVAGFPTKLGEYFCSLRPVVITKYGDIIEYFVDGYHACLAEPDNFISVKDKILFLLNNPKKAKVIGENGYNWSKENQEYIGVTKKINVFLDSL